MVACGRVKEENIIILYGDKIVSEGGKNEEMVTGVRKAIG